MGNKTAVQWLIEQIKDDSTLILPRYYRQFNNALQMEREQIEQAWDKGDSPIADEQGEIDQEFSSPQDYYNKTYNQQNNEQ